MGLAHLFLGKFNAIRIRHSLYYLPCIVVATIEIALTRGVHTVHAEYIHMNNVNLVYVMIRFIY